MMISGTSVIMAYTNSDQVKRSINNLEKYRLFTENKLKQFILKEFNQCSSILRKIMPEGEINHLLTQLPLTVEERNNLVVMYYRILLPVWRAVWYRAGVVCTECLLIFGTYSIDWFRSWFLHFSWIEYSSEAIKASRPFAFISLSWNRYETDI